jgi:hypothetical protein
MPSSVLSRAPGIVGIATLLLVLLVPANALTSGGSPDVIACPTFDSTIPAIPRPGGSLEPYGNHHDANQFPAAQGSGWLELYFLGSPDPNTTSSTVAYAIYRVAGLNGPFELCDATPIRSGEAVLGSLIVPVEFPVTSEYVVSGDLISGGPAAWEMDAPGVPVGVLHETQVPPPTCTLEANPPFADCQ